MPNTNTQRFEDLNDSHNSVKILGATALAALVVVSGVAAVNHGKKPQSPDANSPRMEYIVKATDTESSILQKAYPDRDWRPLTSVVEDQLPKADRHNHIVRAGEVLTFGTDAKIGHLEQGISDSGSGSEG